MPARIAFLPLALIALAVAVLWWPSARQTTPAGAVGGDFFLPWEPGRRMFTLQGQVQGSHTGAYNQYAYDFNLSAFDGSPFTVAAARAGTVKSVQQSSDSSPDCDLRYYNLANNVILDHGDGTGTMYSHLLKNSALVTAGQKVAQGQPLARSDHSGYVCGAGHLHFTVLDLKTYAGLDRPFADKDVQRDGGRPRTNQAYISDSTAVRSAQLAPRAFIPYLTRTKRR